ncbi:F-box/WD repeat-containing protein sel-10-like isoform X2 [Macrobrachium nipponense]|uniref:F-box/WD repeat-containing protein sel-10-like isoform X2 n=1 Tax=Macrobrachium nipponense TaxID=159736 RepID=UPI0030C7A554
MSKLEMVLQCPDEEKHAADAESVRVHGDKVFSCGDDGKVKVFDRNLKLIKDLAAHDYAVYDVFVFGDTLFTGSIDTKIKTWDANTFELKKTIESHDEAVRRFCTDGKLIYAGDEKGEVRGYTPEGELSVLYNVVEEVWSMYAKGDLLYTVRDRGITITQLKGEDNKFCHIQSLDGRAPIYANDDWLIFPDTSGLSLDVRENNKTSGFALKGQLKGTEMIVTAASGHGTMVVTGSWDSELRLWDLRTMKETGRCSIPGVPNGIAVGENGDVYAVGVGGFICKLKASA